MLKNYFFYPILCAFIYTNIRTYLENKNKFVSIFESIENINTKINNIEKFINRKRVQFKNDKQFINRTNSCNSLDIDENNYSTSEED